MAPFALLALVGSVVALDASAPVTPDVRERVTEPPHTWLQMRGGLTNDPTLLHVCAEVAPLDGSVDVKGQQWHTGLSFEACGNGSGFLFQSAAPEIAHFHSRLKLWAFDSDVGWFEPLLSLGFAELQNGPDVPGFSFEGTGPGGTSTAGPEAGVAMRYKVPLPAGFELLLEAGLSVAYFAHARELATPADPVQTSINATAGIGW